ncbi:MAG: Cys-tRNA(Pro)/Cys-tRNA(Cys) deacylase YbaK [Pseudomonadota bacterium]
MLFSRESVKFSPTARAALSLGSARCMEKASKTNACRTLDQQRIGYQLRSYEIDLDDLSAEHVADKIGLPSCRVYKCRKTRHHLCVGRSARPADLTRAGGLPARHRRHTRRARARQEPLTSLTCATRGGSRPSAPDPRPRCGCRCPRDRPMAPRTGSPSPGHRGRADASPPRRRESQPPLRHRRRP